MVTHVQQIAIAGIVAAAAAMSSVPAQAVTFDLATLNGTRSSCGRSCYSYSWYDSVLGTYIFNNSGAQQNPWTEGTGAGAASLEFFIPGQGNNSGKVYISSGSPSFPLPTGQTVGALNSVNSGYFSQYDGFPLYFGFSNSSGSTLMSVVLNSLYIASAPSTGFTVLGYSGLPNQGGNLLDSFTMISPNTTLQEVTLNWTDIEYVAVVGSSSGTCLGGFSCANGFYVNDIEVNDPLPALPEPATIALMGFGLLGIGVYGRRRANH